MTIAILVWLFFAYALIVNIVVGVWKLGRLIWRITKPKPRSVPVTERIEPVFTERGNVVAFRRKR